MEEMTAAEWESLCDGCGRCCLVKLEDEDTGEVHFTDLGCRLLDGATCRCTDYARRRRRVRDCIKLTPEGARSLPWLPRTCGYRVVAEGRASSRSRGIGLPEPSLVPYVPATIRASALSTWASSFRAKAS